MRQVTGLTVIFSIALALTSCKALKKASTDTGVNQDIGIENLAFSINSFGFDLYKQAGKDRENLIFSPYSISSALAMTYAGAREGTKDEMAEVLYFPDDDRQLHPVFKRLNDTLATIIKSPGSELIISNAIWAQDGFDFRADYFNILKEHYRTTPLFLDFIQPAAREKSRLSINKWVEENTREKIRDMIEPGILDANTRLILTNAIYFNGEWEQPFDEKASLPSLFHISTKRTVEKDFMNMTRAILYYEDTEVQMLSLPYKNSSLSMILILPKAVESWKMVGSALDQERFCEMIREMERKEVHISLPRFKLESEFNLKDQLTKLGMPGAFSNDANFSGISTDNSLRLDEVIHKATIDVNEKGTEAAAATAAIIGLKSAWVEKPVEFIADHPFIYLIFDHLSGCVLFYGRLVSP